jgi:hypothetical protein
MAHAKGYLSKPRWAELDGAYEVCDRMLERLYQRLSEWQGTTRTGSEVRESASPYGSGAAADEWEAVAMLTEEVLAAFEEHSP